MERFLLILHVIAGVTTFVTGVIAMVTPKRLKWHKPTGKVFYGAMWAVIVTAFILCIIKFNVFLFMVGLLVFFTNTTGFRFMAFYRGRATKPDWKDWTAWLITLVLLITVNIIMAQMYGVKLEGMLIIVYVFSGGLLLNLIQDLPFLLGKRSSKKFYLKRHVARMGGTFIASLTAAFVQNVHTNPVWFAWLLPTALITPFIAYYSAQIRKGTFWKKAPSEKLSVKGD